MLSKTRADKRALALLDTSLSLPQLLQIHGRLVISGAASGDPFASGKLVAALCSSSLDHSVSLLLHLPRITHYLWNTVIRAHAELHRPHGAFALLNLMLSTGLLPNNYTFSFLLRSASDLRSLTLAEVLHSLIAKLGWEHYDFVQNGLIHTYADLGSINAARVLFDASPTKDVISWTAMVSGYTKCGRIFDARSIFDEMPVTNSVSWSTMITAYSREGMFWEALESFNKMQLSGVKPNHAGIVGGLSACGFLGALDQGRWIHAFVEREGMELDPILATALIDMYSKCGCIVTARKLFDETRVRDVYTYTAMISGLANHDLCSEAMFLFSRMTGEGVVPNEVTFIAVLTACSRTGMVDRGKEIFRSMSNVYGVRPGVGHYGCLVELLGRAGLVEEVKNVVADMPMEPDSYVLGSMLKTCSVHRKVSLGAETLESLVTMGIDQGGVHVLLSNMFAASDRWGEVAKLRTEMDEKEVRKVPGCSMIEVDGVACEFIAGDRSHPLVKEISATIMWADKHLKSFGNGSGSAMVEILLCSE